MSEIDDRAVQLGFGPASGAEASDGRLRWKRYGVGATVVSGPRGVFAVVGEINNHYWRLGGPTCGLGAPVTDELPTGDEVGRYNDFEQGSIYWTDPTGAHEIHGNIGVWWVRAGRHTAGLGYPITDELWAEPYAYQYFQYGALRWTPQAGVERGCPPNRLFGIADTHSHMASHLGFGGRIVHGTVEGTPQDALRTCETTHGAGGTGFGAEQGSVASAFLLPFLNEGVKGHRTHGWPDFDGWPNFGPAEVIPIHQQMFLPWIERAHQHGLRLMVALACHSRDLADLQGIEMSDWEAGQVQIRYVKQLAARNPSWMAVVRTPEEARAVISEGRLAIILGLELDTLGNLNQPHGTPISDSTLQDLVTDIVNMDVRYVFPVHLNDNTFAGMALYKWEFMASSGSAGRPVETVPDGSVTWKPPLTSGPGVVNAKGLSNAGERLLRLLMDQGLLIDIDHMSWASTQRALQLATEGGRRYPLVSGHATFLELAPRDDEHDGPNESRKKAETLRALRELGSYVGVQPTTLRVTAHPQAGGGSVDDADGSSTSFNRAYRYAVHHMGGRVAIGTDFNGLAPTCSPRFGPQGAHKAPEGQAAAQQVRQRRGVRYTDPVRDLPVSRIFREGPTTWSEKQMAALWAVLHFRAGTSAPWTFALGTTPPVDPINVPAVLAGFRATRRPDGGRERAAYVASHPREARDGLGAEDRQIADLLADMIVLVDDRMKGPNPPLTRCTTGNHDWDLNTDGLAHYGLLPDFVADLGNTGLNWDTGLMPLLTSAETVVDTWERCTHPDRRGPATARHPDPRTLAAARPVTVNIAPIGLKLPPGFKSANARLQQP